MQKHAGPALITVAGTHFKSASDPPDSLLKAHCSPETRLPAGFLSFEPPIRYVLALMRIPCSATYVYAGYPARILLLFLMMIEKIGIDFPFLIGICIIYIYDN